MKKKLCLMLTGAFFSVFASGCASSGTAPSGKTSHPEQPSWTKTGKYIKYPGSFYITGSGVSSKSFKEADDFARQELAKQIKVHVKGVDEITTSESREMIGETSRIKTRSNVRSAIKVEVNLLLEGIKISERWFDRDQGNYYSFAFLDREEAVKRLDLKLKEARIAASDLILRGEENEKKGKYFKALKNHLKAYSILKPLEPDILMRTVLAGELSEDSPFSEKGVSPSKAIRKIDKIISSLKLKKVSGDMQKARSNYPLDSPLVAKVVYESPDGLRPVQGLPVLFSFERGKGDLAREAWSDEFGVVKARVSHVESNGTGQNSIALSLNAQKVLASLTDEAPRLRAALSEKRIIFSYTFPSIYPQEQKAPLSRGQGLKELAGKLVNNIKGLKEVSVFQLVVFDFVELISQNRLTFSNTLENELKTNLALLRNVNVEVIDKKNDEAGMSPVEKARAINVPHVVTGGYQIEKEGIKVTAKIIDTKSEVLISAAEVTLRRQDVPQVEFVIEGAEPENKEYFSTVNAVLDKKPRGNLFTIDIWTDKKEYQIGEKVEFFFRADKDCHLTLINIGTSGRITYLFPNQFHRESFIKGGKTYSIPGPDYGFKIDVGGPPGLERIKAIASDQPLPVNKISFTKGFLSIQPENRQRTRDLTVSVQKLPPTGWTEATYEFYVKSPKGIRYRGLKKKPIFKPEKPVDILGTQGYSK